MSELLKLILIVGIGLVILIIGFVRIQKKKKAQLESMMGYAGGESRAASFAPTLSPEEEKAKNYINQYKDSYPRESLKVALVNSGNSEADVNVWLDRYMK